MFDRKNLSQILFWLGIWGVIETKCEKYDESKKIKVYTAITIFSYALWASETQIVKHVTPKEECGEIKQDWTSMSFVSRRMPKEAQRKLKT